MDTGHRAVRERLSDELSDEVSTFVGSQRPDSDRDEGDPLRSERASFERRPRLDVSHTVVDIALNSGELTHGERAGFESRLLWSTESTEHPSGLACRLVAGHATDRELMSDILSVRCQTDDRWPDQRAKPDPYSDHYCMYVENKPVGSLGVTRAIDGPIFLEEYCPPPLLEDFRDCLVSAFRFRILATHRRSSSLVPGLALSGHMVREAWRDQIAKGVGIDLINIERTHVPLYARMGYVVCDGYDYVDPVLGTESALMFLPIDPDRPSFIRDIIQESNLHVSVHDVIRSLTRARVALTGT